MEAFFAALVPAEVDLLEEVLAAQQTDQAHLAQHYAEAVSRAEYEAGLAQRQYQAVDPDDRLVASELERRWELALQALAEAREAPEQFARQAPAPRLAPEIQVQLRELERTPNLAKTFLYLQSVVEPLIVDNHGHLILKVTRDLSGVPASISTPINLRPNFKDASGVVPLPTHGSTTRPFGSINF